MFVKIGKGSSSDFKNIRLDSGFRTKLLNLLQYRQLDNKACIFLREENLSFVPTKVGVG